MDTPHSFKELLPWLFNGFTSILTRGLVVIVGSFILSAIMGIPLTILYGIFRPALGLPVIGYVEIVSISMFLSLMIMVVK